MIRGLQFEEIRSGKRDVIPILLDEYRHVRSVDQALAADPPRLDAGDTVLFLAAGTGYTWAATVMEWG